MIEDIRTLIHTAQLPVAWSKCSEALGQFPDDAELNFLAGQIQYMAGHLDVAERFLNKACQLQPDSSNAYHLLSVILDKAGQKEKALQVARKASMLAPNNPEICQNLGALLTGTDDFNDAEPFLVRAKELDNARGAIRDNLGNLYRRQLRHEESLREYQKAVSLEPANIRYRIHAIKALDCCPNTDPSDFYTFAKATGEMIEERFPLLFQQYKKPGKTINIGYLASTLRRHSVTYFLLPILENHSKRFDIYSYHLGDKEDETTARIKNLSRCYRHLHGMRADEAAKQIHDDGIDILIDLDGYTEIDTLQVLSHKPSPVQITWIGCPGTLGMSRVDYRIVDHYTDPENGVADGTNSETLIRMPQCFSVYSPPRNSPAVSETPAIRNGHITFGSFNIFAKLNQEVIGVWADVLLAVPHSILLLKHISFEQASMRKNVVSAFARCNVSEDRLEFSGFEERTEDHFRRYDEVDIALDPFPYSGTTTSCDALWMGVPVITLAGNRHVSRVGVSLLHNVGNPELVAQNPDEYVDIAERLAGDIEKLNDMRLTLRSKMSDSPLMNATEFTSQLESRLIDLYSRSSGAD